MNDVIMALGWVYTLIRAKSYDRKVARQIALEGIARFEGRVNKATGETVPTELGQELVDSLNSDYEFIGFVPSIVYMKEKGSQAELNAQWVHPFSCTTLLYKRKGFPYLILANGNLAFNDSRLLKISDNIGIRELKHLLGITG